MHYLTVSGINVVGNPPFSRNKLSNSAITITARVTCIMLELLCSGICITFPSWDLTTLWNISVEGDRVDHGVSKAKRSHTPVSYSAFSNGKQLIPRHQTDKGNQKEHDSDANRVFQADVLFFAIVNASLVEQTCCRPHKNCQGD